MRTKTVVFICLLCMLTSTAWAQVNSTFTIVLQDSTGKALSGKSVALFQNGSKIFTLTENPSVKGEYRNTGVTDGTYDIVVDGSTVRSQWIGGNKVTLVVSGFDSSGKLTISAFPDSLLGLKQMTTATVNFIGSGGSITNNPDGTTLENKSGSTLGIHTAYLDSIRRSFEAFAGAPDSGFATLDSLGVKQRIVNEKVINLRDYNPVADGVFDDGPKIQKAIDDANTQNKTVYIPVGNYALSTALITYNNSVIEGAGWGTKLISLGTNNVVQIDTDTSVVIRGIWFEGSNGATSGNDGSGITGTGNDNIKIEYCKFTKFSSRAISLTNTDNSSLFKNYVLMDSVSANAFDAAGIQLYWGSDHNDVSKNVLISTHPYDNTLDWNIGIFIQRNIFGKAGPKYNSVTENYIEGFNKYGIMFYASTNSVTGNLSSDDTLMVGNSAIGNLIKNTGNMAIYNAGSDKTSLIANVIDSSGALLVDENLPRGAISQSAGRYCVLNGNIISNTLKFHGISVGNSHGTTVDRNQIWNFEQDGIKVASGNVTSGGTGGAMEDTTESYVGISNNRIFQNFHATLGNGIRLQGPKKSELEFGVDISHNRIRNVKQTGILISNGMHLTVNDNVIDDVGRRGINADSLDYSSIRGNIITNVDTANSAQSAIVIDFGSSYNRIESNILVNDNPAKGFIYGIHIVSSSDTGNVIINNTILNPKVGKILDSGIDTEKGEERTVFLTDFTGTSGDQSANIMRAIDSVAAQGKELIVPPGTYQISSEVLILNKSNIKITGVEGLSKFQVISNNINAFKVDNSTDIIFRGITILGDSTTATTLDGNGILAVNSTGIEVRDCLIQGFGGAGVFFMNTSRSKVIYNRIESGIAARNDASDIVLLKNSDFNLVAHNECLSNNEYGIFVQKNDLTNVGSPDNNVVFRNRIRGNKTKTGILFYTVNTITATMADSDSVPKRNVAMFNDILGAKIAGIWSFRSSYVKLIGNTIDSCGIGQTAEPAGGIVMQENIHVTVTENEISNQVKFHGISALGLIDGTFRNNKIVKPELQGIKLTAASFALRDILVDDAKIDAPGSDGIFVQGTDLSNRALDITITNSKIRNATLTGITMFSVKNATLEKNQINFSGTHGIVTDSTDFAIITENIVTNGDTANSTSASAILLNAHNDRNQVFMNTIYNDVATKGFNYGITIVSNTDSLNTVKDNLAVNMRTKNINLTGGVGSIIGDQTPFFVTGDNDSLYTTITDTSITWRRSSDGVEDAWVRQHADKSLLWMRGRKGIYMIAHYDTILVGRSDDSGFGEGLQLPEWTATPSLPTSGYGTLWADGSDNHLKWLSDAGVVYDLTQGTGGGGGGEANTASNFAGPGEGLFKVKSGVNLEFWEVVADSNIQIWTASDGVHIAASLPPDSTKIWDESATLDSAKSTHLINIRNQAVVRDRLTVESGFVKTGTDSLYLFKSNGDTMMVIVDNSAGTLAGHQLEIVGFLGGTIPVVSFGVDEATTNPTGGNWRMLDSGVSKSANVKAVNVTGSLKVNVLAADSLRLLIEDDGISPTKLEDEVTTLYRSLTWPDSVKVGQYFELGSSDSTLKPLRLRAITDQGTCNIMIEHRSFASLNSTGTNLMAAELVADTNGQKATTFSVDPIPAGQYVVAVIKSVSATVPKRLFIELKSQINE